nr:ribonuclease H-like domain-containing protein [Tanacetum cinerariifolium]
MLLAKKDKDEQVLLVADQAWMESSSDSDQEINANMVFMDQIEKVLSYSKASSSSADEKISEMSRDMLTIGSTMMIPLLYRGEYSQWSERFMNYLEEQTDGEALINCIKHGDQPLPHVTQVSIAGTSSIEQPPLKDKIMCNKTAKDLWDALVRHMLGSEYGEQDRKAAVLYEYETFKATEEELFLDTYIRYLQKKYATMMRQNKDLMDINIDALYNILKQNQGDVNDDMGLKKKTVVVTSNLLALIVEKTKMSKRKEKVVVSLDSEGSDADDFSELKKITALLAKAFNRRKFYSKPTNKTCEHHPLLSLRTRNKNSEASSSSSDDKITEIVQICLWIIDSGCSKHMTDGVDLLTGDRSSSLYTIAFNEVASNSSACLLAKASSSQSWLWHQRLSHLNFATINNLVKNNLVQGLSKMKFKKDHLCSAYEQEKSHRKHHKSKTDFASNKPLYLLHMDLCGPMRLESINEKRYVLVVVNDYSRYTWVLFLHLKDEASEVIISFIKKTQVNLQVQHVRTDNGTEFKNKTLAKFFDEDIIVFGGYSKEFVAFRIYNKRTRKIHESVNVNFDEISEMASKQFSLELDLSNLNETGKSSNLSVSQVSETSKKDLEDLFQKIFDEYFDSSMIMKSSTTNVKTSNVEIPSNEKEVFHESSESFQKESSFSLNNDVQQSSEEVEVPSLNTQSISNNMVPNVDEASSSHNVFNERLEDAYFDASTSFHDPSNVHNFYQPYQHEKK